MEIPINAAKKISDEYKWPIVVIYSCDDIGRQHVTTYGKTELDSVNAAKKGNNLKASLNWPDALCRTRPCERICINCTYYEPNYGTHCFNGWTGDGSNGDCVSNPKKIKRKAKDRACKFFEGKEWN